MNYVLLMTACIQPKNLNRPTFRLNPLTRLSDYKKSLNYWLTYDDTRIKSIVFADNSGFNLDELILVSKTNNTYNRQIEFLQFTESERPQNVHYGYSDMEIVDYAIMHSRNINNDSVIIKTTGRLYFPKLYKLLNTEDRKDYDFLADSRDFKFGKKEKHYVITTLFLVKPLFYKNYLYNTKIRLLEKQTVFMETLYFQILKSLSSDKIQLRFPFNVDAVGVGAHWNNNYASFQKKLESFVRTFIRKFFPRLKL